MKQIILLNKEENTHIVEEEEKQKFLYQVLLSMGIPISEVWQENTTLSITQKVQLRAMLKSFDVEVLDDFNGHMQIYVANEKIAEWNKPLYVLKTDLRELDPKKRLYYEMHTDYSTIFEEPSQNE